jgi:hypothetical protein
MDSITFSNILTNGFTANFEYNFYPDKIGIRFGVDYPPLGEYSFIDPVDFQAIGSVAEDTLYFVDTVLQKSGVNSTSLIASVRTSNAIPSNFTAVSITYNSIIMGWDESSSPTTGYTIWISLEFGVFDTPISLGDVTSHEFTGLSANTLYFFKIIDLGGEPSPTPSEPNYTSVITSDYPVPDPPVDFQISESTLHTLSLVWSGPTANYNIYKSLTTDFTDLLLVGAPPYTFTGLDANTLYYFKLEAVNEFNMVSSPVFTSGSTLPIPQIKFNSILYIYTVTD